MLAPIHGEPVGFPTSRLTAIVFAGTTCRKGYAQVLDPKDGLERSKPCQPEFASNNVILASNRGLPCRVALLLTDQQ